MVWREAPSTRALLALLCASAQPAAGSNEVVAFAWDSAEKRFSTACAANGVRLLWNGDLDAWLGEHPDVIPALQRGEDVSFAGRVLLPMTFKGRLEGVLSITLTRPFDSSARAGLQNVCQLGASVLAGLRERDEALQVISTAAHDLGTPLMAARGFTRMALEDIRCSPACSQREYLSATLKNIDRLVEVAVGLQHARADA
jgi:signal transduction histidine kinase